MSSTKTVDGLSPVDKNTTDGGYDTSSQTCTSTDNEIETTGDHDETTPVENIDVTNADNPQLSFSTSAAFRNR